MSQKEKRVQVTMASHSVDLKCSNGLNSDFELFRKRDAPKIGSRLFAWMQMAIKQG